MRHRIKLLYEGCSINGYGETLSEAANDLIFNMINCTLTEDSTFIRVKELSHAVLIAADNNIKQN